MTEITAALVKELRECTGAGMMECKKALVESAGDMDGAIDILRTRGLAAIAKKAGRATNEGVVAAYVSEDGTVGALLEVNCETDFVARNEKFGALAADLVATVAAENPADVEDLKSKVVAGSGLTVENTLAEAVNVLGENIQLSRFVRRVVDGAGAVSSYIHGGGRIGVLVEFSFGKAETGAAAEFKALGRDIAMQVAAACPLFTCRDESDPTVIEHELTIYRAQAAESGKPEAIQEKMAQGRIEKFFKENALVEQPFVKNPDASVSAHVAEVAKSLGDTIEVVGFTRFVLGESISE